MRLYFFPIAPNPTKVRLYLAEKTLAGASFAIEPVLVDLRAGEQKSPEHLARNPMGKLPVLEIEDGHHLTESLPIILYLEDLCPEPPMLGSTPRERADTLSVERFADLGVLLPIARIVHATDSPLGVAPNPAIAEHFRDEQQRNVLLLMDNVFRFVQAGAEVSGLLGRMASRVGYQPTLATEVAELQERIAGRGDAAITAIQAVYVPADDFPDPAVTTIASHVDSTVVLSRAMAADGMYPAVDPIASTSILLDPAVMGEDHVAVANQVRRTIEHYRELQDVISLLGVEELGREDRQAVARARRLQRFLTQPFAVTEAFTGIEGRSVSIADTIAGCKAILAGEADDWEESSLYMIGTFEEARAKEAAARDQQAVA